VATLDFDRDGKIDVALSRNASAARLLRNASETQNHWLALRLQGTRSNRDGIGAKVTLVAGGRRWVAERKGGSSYLSAPEGPVHFGLGRHVGSVRIEIRWPSGLTEAFEEVAANRILTLVEASGKPAP
jgi:hypothetical protein